MHAALSGLIGWKGLQVVVTKNPVDHDGKSLVPQGLDIKVIRYFPLAELLHAFDAAVAAAGYNGVHELLPAGLATVFVPNIRGTDDQVSRARWTHEQGFALAANSDDLGDITSKVRLLQQRSVRERLVRETKLLPALEGNDEAASFYLKVVSENHRNMTFKVSYLHYLIKTQARRRLRALALSILRALAILYRTFFPRKVEAAIPERRVIFSAETRASELSALIKSPNPLEHLISGASEQYRKSRARIADRAYKDHASSADDSEIWVDSTSRIIEESL
jgi:hypothetical protein